MLKPSILNILLFWFAKYIALYVFMMFKNNNFAFMKVNEIKTGEDLFYYLWLFLFLPVVSMLIFTAPVYFSFKVKSVVYFALIIAAVLIVEYFVYTYLASPSDFINGVYNGIISMLFLLLFFFRHISAIYQQQSIQ